MIPEEATPEVETRRLDAGDDLAILISRARKGELEVLGGLYERHGVGVYRVAYRLTGSRQDAEDVLHDVFVGLPEALDAYEERGRFDAWIRQVAARAALMRLRRSKIRERRAATAEPPRSSSAGSVVDRIAIERALRRLPDGLRAVFVLKEIEGFSHAEVAGILGITESASSTRLHRACRRLRAMLEGFES